MFQKLRYFYDDFIIDSYLVQNEKRKKYRLLKEKPSYMYFNILYEKNLLTTNLLVVILYRNYVIMFVLLMDVLLNITEGNCYNRL